MNDHTDAKTIRLTGLFPAVAVHAAGCSDAAKALARGYDTKSRTNVDGSQDYEGSTTAEALQAIADDLTAGFGGEYTWKVSDLTIYPCVHKGPVAPKPVPAGRCAGAGQPFKFERSSDRMRLYYPCPVCGKYMGTGRGVVPAHKAKA